mmetsp:Transcript_87845/g.250285  ORF Transcript_87845/g.250285 Transcript_87845/m.250285 type:complete len:129 (-) Transcript_87845:1138-1524(-)
MLKFFNKDECENHYKFGKTLGQGSFATVKQAIRKGKKKGEEGGQKLAVKIIIKTALNNEDKAALETEVAVMEKLKHDNIVELVEVFDCTVRMRGCGLWGGGLQTVHHGPWTVDRRLWAVGCGLGVLNV